MHEIFITTYYDYLQRWCRKIWYILVNFLFLPFYTQPWICFQNLLFVSPLKRAFLQPNEFLFGFLVLLVHGVLPSTPDAPGARSGARRSGGTRGDHGAWDLLDTPQDQTQRLPHHWAPENERSWKKTGDDILIVVSLVLDFCFFFVDEEFSSTSEVLMSSCNYIFQFHFWPWP